MLVKRVFLRFSIGYVPAGPVVLSSQGDLASVLVEKLLDLTRKDHIVYLIVHPARPGEEMAKVLELRGFRPSAIELIPTATLLIDLKKSEEELLADMSKKRRKAIRHAVQDEKIVIREVGESDLPTAYSLLASTGARKGFRQEPQELFGTMWRAFHQRGMARATIAEVDNEPVAMEFAIRFGDTVYMKRKGWSGMHSKLSPNDFVHWEMITWHQSHGCTICDAEGIGLEVAREILLGEKCPYDWHKGNNQFKYDFGGDVVIYVGAYEYIPNSLFRWMFVTLFPRIRSRWPVKNIWNHFRGR